MLFFFFFFNDTATTEIYTLSLHDALPIYLIEDYTGFESVKGWDLAQKMAAHAKKFGAEIDRKSTRLNSSHVRISYAVFCLKKKKKKKGPTFLIIISDTDDQSSSYAVSMSC